MKLNELLDNNKSSMTDSEKDQQLANFEFQILDAIQERQKKLKPEVFRKVKEKEEKS